MSGGGTSVSGMRAPNASRRGETRRVEKRWIGFGWGVHVVIAGLAVLLWGIARDMVVDTRTLQDTGRVRFELADELEGKWRIFSQETTSVHLEVSGPIAEINKFAGTLDKNPGRFAYRYEIGPTDIANLPVNSRQQVTLTVDIGRFAPTGEAAIPTELNVRPVGSERIFQVTLERFIQRPAYVDLGTTARGQIQVQIPRADGRPENRVYTYASEVRLERPIEVYGPASLVDATSDQQGQARLRVSVDAREALDNFAKSKNQSVEEVLQGREVVSIVQLLPIEGVVVRVRDQELGVAQVPVRFVFDRQQDYVQVSREFGVDVILPNWLSQRGARVENLPNTIPVDIRVLSSQRSNFTEQNVRVRLDLSSLNRADLEIESVEGTQVRRARVLNWYYSLDINTSRLTYQFFNENVTAEQYLPIGEITLVWTD